MLNGGVSTDDVIPAEKNYFWNFIRKSGIQEWATRDYVRDRCRRISHPIKRKYNNTQSYLRKRSLSVVFPGIVILWLVYSNEKKKKRKGTFVKVTGFLESILFEKEFGVNTIFYS